MIISNTDKKDLKLKSINSNLSMKENCKQLYKFYKQGSPSDKSESS